MLNKLPFAKKLRADSTNVENIFWYYCRDRRFEDHKFRRQVPIGTYIVDFVCHEKFLIVEFDGGQHNTPENQAKDEVRTNYLKSRGYTILRFWNNEFLENKEGVLSEIKKYL